MTSGKKTFEKIIPDSAVPCDDTPDGSSAKQASTELIEILSDEDVDDDFAVARAERALGRYTSPSLMSEQDLRNMMQAEKAGDLIPFALCL